MSKFEEWVNDFTIMGDDGAVIFSSYDLFLEFIEEIVVDERKREREACAKLCDEIAQAKTYQTGYLQETAEECVEEIRARGNHD